LPGPYFDYFAFHRKVESAAHAQLSQLSPLYIEGGHQLPFVVGYIFATALRSEQIVEAAGTRTLGLDGVRTGSQALVTAGKAVEAFLAQKT
jgi:hypothetical protein